MITLSEFKSEFLNDVRATAESSCELTSNIFFENYVNHLIDAGDIETADRCFFEKRGVRIDGYGGDPIDSENILSLIVCDMDDDEELTEINRTEIEQVCKRAVNFVSSSLSSRFFNELDEYSDEFGLADLIRTRWESILKIRILFLTTRILKVRKTQFDPIPVNGKTASFACWDIARLSNYVQSNKDQEPISVELKDHGGALSVLPAHTADTALRSYLCAIPGQTLASIYDEYGAKLLEKNVRVFLQSKGKVNKGIRATIETAPSKFFAYNNGITATAEGVETCATKHGIALTSIDDLQIVNGGQTSASIYDAFRRGIDLSQVYIQMKLTVVSEETASKLVPEISKFANSQNRVSEADFFSNHAFHISFEKYSRSILAPPKEGTTLQTYWFYERARGQYANSKSLYVSRSERTKFQAVNPSDQRVTKTDLAKVMNTFKGLPHIVSKGAQSSFKTFADFVNTIWEKDDGRFVTDVFYKKSIARIILFRHLEKSVSKSEWYQAQAGYRANIVCYTLAKFSETLKKSSKTLDYLKIWNAQCVPVDLSQELVELAEIARNHIVNPPSGSPSNITEYAKTEQCWILFSKIEYKVNQKVYPYLLSKTDSQKVDKESEKKKKFANSIEEQEFLIGLGGSFWSSVLEYSSQNNLVTSRDWELLSRASQFPGRLLDTDKEYKQLYALLKRARRCGFTK